MLIAQERMSSNHVYCFHSKSVRRCVTGLLRGTRLCSIVLLHQGAYVAEIRSMMEGSTRPTGSLYIKLVKPPKSVSP